MIKKQSILILSIMLMAGLMFSSCTRDVGGDKIDPDGNGTGCLSLNISIDGLIGKTRAEGESTGLEAESQMNSIRVIFYNSLGKAVYINQFDLFYDYEVAGYVWTADYRNTNSSVIFTHNSSDNTMGLLVPEIKKQDYKILVIINPTSNYSNLSNMYEVSDWSDPNNDWLRLGERSFLVGHSSDYFTRPRDLTAGFFDGGIYNGYNPSSMYASFYDNGGAMASLTALSSIYQGNRPLEGQTSDLYLLMMNSDGLLEVSADQLSSSIEQADLNPVNINVERVVAKIAVFNQFTSLKHGAQIGDGGTVNWVPDILNYHTYLVRKKAPTAGGGTESATTPRKLRYAADPNFSGISTERPGGGDPQKPVELTFYTQKTAITNNINSSSYSYRALDEDNMFYRTANTQSYMSDGHEWDYWDYVPENTMTAGEQYEDVTTRVLVRLSYVPHEDQITRLPSGSGATIDDGTGYYSYKNKLIFTMSDMNAIAADAGNIESQLNTIIAVASDDEVKSLLEELKTVLADADTRSWFSNFPASPTAAASYNNLNFHAKGRNYYYVLIRHFDDTIESRPMAYGRYGVVRNNVYKIVLTNINGPGYGVIPDPKGPDDKVDLMESTIRIANWTSKPLDFDL